MTGTFNIDQININITDVIPPENFATVDAGANVGTVYTKAQDDEWRAEVEQNVTSGIKGIAKPDDTVPATGFFRMLVDSANTYTNYKDASNASIVVSAQDINIVNGVRKNEVTIEVNNGVSTKVIYAKVGSDGANGTGNIPDYNPALSYVEKSRVFKNGSDWRVADGQTANIGDVPGVSVKWVSLGTKVSLVFDPLTETNAQGGKQIYDYYSTIKEGTAPKTEITARIVNNYVNDSAQLLPLNGYTTTGVIDLSDDVKVINVSNWNPPTNNYGIKFYTVNNVFIVENKQKGTFNIDKPSNAAKFAISYINFSASSDFKVYTSPLAPIEDKGTSSKVDIVDTAVKYKPVNSVAVAAFFQSNISIFADSISVETFYQTNIKSLKISIDDFTGTDDERIEKATAMIENVGGGQIYFPTRQINITKAILITSNTRFILDNCQIQMVNSIHDNIFRAKGLKINSSAPNGIQTEASWTQNFEIIGIGMPTIRQSVTPLHVGDAYGWRGISVLFARCRNYKLMNLKVIESHMWSISNEFSERGYFENLEFSNTLHANADGLNFRNGCRDMYAKKLRGITNDNALATTILDSTIPVSPNAGYSYQALGWTFGDYWGAENIIVEDVQVRSRYGSALILGTSRIVQNITYKDVVSTSSTPSGQDWDNVSVCGNRYRNFVYGSSYVDGNVRNINIINSNTSVHEYSLGVYGGNIQNLFTNKIINTKPGKLGDVKNDTTTVINQV